jgi:UDP-N-acetyl-D-galactosamine dehydrogenase
MKIAVIGLGYVGLPLALGFAKHYPGTVGFDIAEQKIALLKRGIDPNREGYDDQIKETSLVFTNQAADLAGCDFFVVGVPTPVDLNNTPDLTPLLKASETVGRAIRKGAIVVFESTVYPGVTEEVCGPKIEEVSGLTCGVDFFLGYSPERINPGDKERTLEKITKVVSGQTPEVLETVARAYSTVVTAGVYRASSIKVAEAAKVIENTQRDLNIALMNELAIIFDRLQIPTKDVLDAAATKWNFLRFNPGLVGGHCIGVDPYYLTMKAEQVGYHPEVILAGRRINDSMGAFVAQRTVKLMLNSGLSTKGARVGVLGLTFKEDVTDLRNSRVPDVLKELEEFGIMPMVHDPHADAEIASHEYGLNVTPLAEFAELDALILAVPHREYRAWSMTKYLSMLKTGGVLVDLKSALPREQVPSSVPYWSL